MTIRYEKRNSRMYAYRCTSKRIPGKKNPVTESIYLGRVDPETGNIIPRQSRQRPKEEHAKEYGAVAVLDAVQKDLGVLEDLNQTFPGLSQKILGAAMAQVIDITSFNDIHYVVDGSIIKERLKLRGSLSPAVMSDLSKDIGSSFSSMDDFFRARVARAKDPILTLDLTSVSSYSKMGGWAEWGHNRDSESLKQTNIAMVTDASGIPLAFTMLPGSIAESTVLDSTVEYLQGLGCNGRLVMDRGFETAANVKNLIDRGISFTIASNAHAEPVKKLMSMAIKDMKSSDAFRRHKGHSYKVAEYELGVIEDEGGCEYVIHVPQSHKGSRENNKRFQEAREMVAFVVYNPRKASDDIDSVMEAVEGTELK